MKKKDVYIAIFLVILYLGACDLNYTNEPTPTPTITGTASPTPTPTITPTTSPTPFVAPGFTPLTVDVTLNVTLPARSQDNLYYIELNPASSYCIILSGQPYSLYINVYTDLQLTNQLGNLVNFSNTQSPQYLGISKLDKIFIQLKNDSYTTCNLGITVKQISEFVTHPVNADELVNVSIASGSYQLFETTIDNLAVYNVELNCKSGKLSLKSIWQMNSSFSSVNQSITGPYIAVYDGKPGYNKLNVVLFNDSNSIATGSILIFKAPEPVSLVLNQTVNDSIYLRNHSNEYIISLDPDAYYRVNLTKSSGDSALFVSDSRDFSTINSNFLGSSNNTYSYFTEITGLSQLHIKIKHYDFYSTNVTYELMVEEENTPVLNTLILNNPFSRQLTTTNEFLHFSAALDSTASYSLRINNNSGNIYYYYRYKTQNSFTSQQTSISNGGTVFTNPVSGYDKIDVLITNYNSGISIFSIELIKK